MTTPAHLFGGYLTLSLTKKIWSTNTSPKTQKWLIIYGLALSLAVDLDVLITRGITNHHKLLTHYPIFWLALSLGFFLISFLLKRNFLKSLAVVTLIASWTHLALDLVGVTMGIHLLWPFSMKEFSITPLKTDFPTEAERLAYIFRSPVMWVGDGLIIMSGIIKMYLDFTRAHKQRTS